MYDMYNIDVLVTMTIAYWRKRGRLNTWDERFSAAFREFGKVPLSQIVYNHCISAHGSNENSSAYWDNHLGELPRTNLFTHKAVLSRRQCDCATGDVPTVLGDARHLKLKPRKTWREMG